MEPKESKSKKHFYYSVIKSGIRVVAGITLLKGQLWYAGIFLIIAEIFGIIEEL